jgi:hypothetical protein
MLLEPFLLHINLGRQKAASKVGRRHAKEAAEQRSSDERIGTGFLEKDEKDGCGPVR